MRYRYHRPANGTDFEALCLRLLQAEWNCPHLQLYGRSGEPQHGVDFFDPTVARPRRGGQCKLVSDDSRIAWAMIRGEVEKAKGFGHLDEYWILTTGRRSKTVQDALLALNDAHRREGLFTVHLLTWDDLQGYLDKHPTVRDQFYPLPGRAKSVSGATIDAGEHARHQAFTGRAWLLERVRRWVVSRLGSIERLDFHKRRC